MSRIMCFSVAALYCAVSPVRSAADVVTLTATLTGDQEVIPVKTTGHGEATVILDTVESTVTVWLEAHDLLGVPYASHIHLGAPGKPGIRIVDLIPPYRLPIVGEVFAIDPLYHEDMLAGDTYVNIHTILYPTGEIRGQLIPVQDVVLPGIVSAATIATHDVLGDLPIAADLDASVVVDSGAVTTETRVSGITRIEIGFADPLDASVGGLDGDAITITPDPVVDVATTLTDGDTTLVLSFTPAIPDVQTYAFDLTESVVAAGAGTVGDRGFELRALAGNVVSEGGAGPQSVNAIDIGLTGIRGRFGADVGDAANTSFDVNQDGSINALDMSCVRLTCGMFGHTSP